MEDTNSEESLEQLMYDSGYNRTLNIFVGFRGPLHKGFRDKWYYRPYRVYILFTDMVLFLNFILFASGFLKPGLSVRLLSRSCFPFLCVSLILYRTVYLWIHRNRFRQLMQEYGTAFPNDPDFKMGLKRFSRMVRLISWLLFCMNLLIVLYAAVPFVQMTMGIPYESVVPFWTPFEEDNIYFFCFAISSTILAATYTPSKCVLCDNLFASYACRHIIIIRHLGKKFNEILTCVKVNEGGQVRYETRAGLHLVKSEATEYITEELKQWIKLHQECNRRAQELQVLMSPMLGIFFFVMCGIVCTSAWCIVCGDMDTISNFFCVAFVMGNAAQLLQLCWLGEVVTSESNVMHQYTLNSHMHLLPEDVNILVRIVLSRFMKPARLKAFDLFPLDTESFRSMMVSSYSFFTMLRKFNN